MTFKNLLPYLLLTFLWGVYSASRSNEQMFIAYALGVAFTLAVIPWAIARLTVSKNSVHAVSKQTKVFLWIWGILLFCNVIVHFNET